MVRLKSKLKQLNDIEIEFSQVLTIGRESSNDIMIDSSYVSAKHAKIYMEDDNVYIVDFDSTNGTYIDGKKLESNQAYKINEKQKVILGSEDAVFELERNLNKENTQLIKNKDVYTIGRKSSNDIVINVPAVSSEHLIVKKENAEWFIYDNNSTNGTYLNSLQNKITSAKLEKNQVVYLGNYKIPTNKILKFLVGTEVKSSGKIQITQDILVLGRDPKSDIHISHPSVSFHHAKLKKTVSGYELEDLDSTNGTYVNGKQVKGTCSVKKDDEIQLGVYSFILEIDDSENASITKKEFLDGMSIEAKDITIEVGNGIKLLDDISFTINPGELVGLMGLSGAGKTTLLKALNGYDKPTNGFSYINGMDLYKNFDMLKTSIGYVPQDDIVHPELTVKEALQFYAKLRLPSDMSGEEIDASIDKILKKLGLDGTQDTIIGSPETEKGISGGQRKRVNLAMELLAEPKVIFLDEPTSGLSAVDTKMVMQQLRALADEGITIIITIHQPSLDNYKFMDNQIILSFGKLAFYGATYPDSIEFFNKSESDQNRLLSNPDNALIGLNTQEELHGELKLNPRNERNKKGIYWKEEYRASKNFQDYVSDRQSKEKSLKSSSSKRVTSIKQWMVFVSRYVKIKLKDISNTSILLIQAPLIGIMIAMLFSKDAYMGLESADIPMSSTLLFVLAISAIWFGTINASREIVAEKAIFERERMIGVNIFPYVMSKFFVLSVLCFIQSIALVGIVEITAPFSLGFGGSLIEIIILTFLTSLGGLSIGLLVSTIAKSQAQALALVPLVLLPMIIFGGGMMSVKQMDDNKNKIAFVISQATPTRWALEEMVRVYDELDDAQKVCTKKYPDMKDIKKPNPYSSCVEKRNFVQNNYGSSKTSSDTVYIMLSMFILIPLLFVIFILKRRDNA